MVLDADQLTGSFRLVAELLKCLFRCVFNKYFNGSAGHVYRRRHCVPDHSGSLERGELHFSRRCIGFGGGTTFTDLMVLTSDGNVISLNLPASPSGLPRGALDKDGSGFLKVGRDEGEGRSPGQGSKGEGSLRQPVWHAESAGDTQNLPTRPRDASPPGIRRFPATFCDRHAICCFVDPLYTL